MIEFCMNLNVNRSERVKLMVKKRFLLIKILKNILMPYSALKYLINLVSL